MGKVIVVIVLMIVMFFGFMVGINKVVTIDAVKQYEIAKQQGSAMDAYCAASYCAIAYLQAHDEVNYCKWKIIEKQEGIRAGISLEMLEL